MAEIAYTRNSIELDENELWFLLAQFGPGVIVGMGDPYRGWPKDQAALAGEKGFRSLLQRGILLPASQHEVFISAQITRALLACHQAETTLIIQFQESGGSLVRWFFHFFDNSILEMTELANSRYQLSFVPSAGQLTEGLRAPLRTDSTAMMHGRPLSLKANQFDRLRTLCADGAMDTATELLLEASLDAELASTLVADLARPVASGAFVAIRSRLKPSANEVTGFAIMEGSHSIWILEPRGQGRTDEVQLTPVDPQMVRDRFLKLLPA